MKPALLTALAVGAATLGIAGPVSAPLAAAAAQRDWTKVVAATPEGGYRIGNPAAPVRLVEYGSLTCDHCAHFHEEAMPKLLGTHVKSGRVSFEFRNFVRDPADLAGALLSRCAGPDKFFAATDGYFDAQKEWIGRYAALGEAQIKELDALPQAQKLARFAKAGGLDAIAGKVGVTPARAAQCLADEAAVKRLAEIRKAAVDNHEVQGTPSFLVNGKLVEAHNWSALEPFLSKPGG